MDLSVVLATYNRCHLLDRAIQALLDQRGTNLNYEVIVVDNNSTDETRQVIESHAAKDKRLKYTLERSQGVAFARNSGIQLARADLIAFCDDDVYVAPDWVQKVYDAFMRFPDADFIGGRVLPVWPSDLPKWLKPTMAPLALQDRGEEPFKVSLTNPTCLISACLGARRQTFDRVGCFDPARQRVKDGIGSTEDYDWEFKVWCSGGHGVYVPNVVCYCEVPQSRMKKMYHRRWHLGHGKFDALAPPPEVDAARRLLGVPRFLYRQLAQNLAALLWNTLSGNASDAFERESHLMFCLGFIWRRWTAQLLPEQKHALYLNHPADLQARALSQSGPREPQVDESQAA
jgi:glucosyl-dolichyl phosphate glucuronosyltransferase